jgi:hypothetical protein
MRGGIHVDQRSLTGGVEGLGRLIKAYLSTGWVLGSMREWADDPVRPGHRPLSLETALMIVLY